jgi:hypothetical protein
MKLKIFVLLIAVLALASCNAVENGSTSGTMLQVVSLTDPDGKLPVFSSVSVNINDNCLLEINARPLDPLMDIKNVTPYMDVLIDQIDVEFRRTDGRNVEGVDVPYRFTQPMSFLVPINGSAKIPFMLIRHVAKLEAPLLALHETQNQAIVLQLVAVVTIHGKDQGGHRVAPVTGYVSVWCGDSFGTTVATGINR